MTDIQKRLFELQDHAYGDFHSGLIPELPREYFIGVRVPVLKKFVKESKKEAESETFLKQLPHTYYEEYMVHILLLGEIKDYDTCMKAVEEFLPYIDNWAICDGLSPKVFKNHKPDPADKEWLHPTALQERLQRTRRSSYSHSIHLTGHKPAFSDIPA